MVRRKPATLYQLNGKSFTLQAGQCPQRGPVKMYRWVSRCKYLQVRIGEHLSLRKTHETGDNKDRRENTARPCQVHAEISKPLPLYSRPGRLPYMEDVANQHYHREPYRRRHHEGIT